jgi:hypothetical protein
MHQQMYFYLFRDPPYIYMYIYIDTHTYIHTYIYIYIYSQSVYITKVHDVGTIFDHCIIYLSSAEEK